MQATHPRRSSVGTDEATAADPKDADWPRFLRMWGLGAGLAMTGLFVAFSTLQSSAADSPLLPQYEELAWATQSPGLYRLGSIFDVAVWLALGGMFVAFGALFAHRARMRATLIAACGAGQIAGVIGAFTRLEGMTKLAVEYNNGGAEQQGELLRSSLDLQHVIYTHFATGSLLWTTALFLIVSVAWRVEHFPRWLAVLMAVTGIMNLTTDVFGMASNNDAPVAVSMVALFGLLVVFFGVGRAFRQKGALRASVSS